MKLRMLLAGAALLGATVLFTNQVVSQDYEQKKGEHEHAERDQGDEMMEAWMKLSEPGEFHAHLKPLVGRWETAVKWRMDPNAPWDESNGRSEYRWIMGGRFLLQQVDGEEMMGERFEGLGIMGFDKVKKKYTSAWVDNMGTAIMTSVGTCDESGKVITMSGEYDDPMTGQKRKEKSILRIANNDTLVYEMYTTAPDGEEFKSLVVTYTRK